MNRNKKNEETATRELKITKHFGRPEYPSYIQVSGLTLVSAAELYFSSEPEGMLVYRICNWLAAFIVERVAEMLDNFEEEEVAMMLQEVKKEPPIMGVGYIQGMLVTTFNQEAAELLEMLRLCESSDDRVYDCFMSQFWHHLENNVQFEFFFKGFDTRKGVNVASGKDDSNM